MTMIVQKHNIILLHMQYGVPYQHTADHGWSSMILLLHGMKIDKNTHTQRKSHHITSYKQLKTTLGSCLHAELTGSVVYGPLNM